MSPLGISLRSRLVLTETRLQAFIERHTSLEISTQILIRMESHIVTESSNQVNELDPRWRIDISPKASWIPPLPCESEIVGAVSESEMSVRGEAVQNSKLRYFNPFELFDHSVLQKHTEKEFTMN